jgi:hypothetical protein
VADHHVDVQKFIDGWHDLHFGWNLLDLKWLLALL